MTRIGQRSRSRGGGVKIFGGEWTERTLDVIIGLTGPGDTIVGNDVWIGNSVTIMPGVRVGDGAIIATGAVVVKDVEPYTIVGGNPAQLIRRRFSEADTERLLRIAWWDWPIETITAHARTIMAGSVDELEKIAAGLG